LLPSGSNLGIRLSGTLECAKLLMG